MKKYGCYNKDKKKHFQSPFHFLISLFSWTPRDRLVNDSGALHCGDAPTGNACTVQLYTHNKYYGVLLHNTISFIKGNYHGTKNDSLFIG